MTARSGAYLSATPATLLLLEGFLELLLAGDQVLLDIPGDSCALFSFMAHHGLLDVHQRESRRRCCRSIRL